MSKNTICFNIHPIKTLCYKLKTGKTLVFKGRLRANTGISLNTYPMSTGEILEQVCKMFTDGYTEGNRSIKVVGDTVTYNTASTDKGDLYCIAYKDGGFYVGKRTSEDYEPKEGDWWCISSNTQNQPYKPYPSSPIVLNNVCPNDSYVIVYDKASHIIFAGTNTNVDSGYYITIQAYVNGSYTAGTTSKTNATDLMWPVRSVTIGNKITFRTGKNVDNIQTDFGINVLTAIGPTCFLMKPISASDILAYKVTGHMGHLMVGTMDVTHATGSGNFAFGSTANPSFNGTWDINTKYLLAIEDDNNNFINLNNTNFIQVAARKSGATDNSKNIAINKVNGCVIMMQTIADVFDEEYLDGTWTFINGCNQNNAVPSTYKVIRVPILQDNRPATLNALNANLLNNNSTDINPINDNENEI